MLGIIKKKWFMLNKLLKDLSRSKHIYDLADDLQSQHLGHYYFLFKEDRISAGKDQALIQRFDADGIPINRTYIDVRDKEYVYFPISVGQMGLAVFHTWLETRKEADKIRFLKFADWYLKQADLSAQTGARWLTDVALPQYHTAGPWASAFSQSRAISILLRAYQLTANKEYASLAEKALVPFQLPVRAGGVCQFTEWGPFYEEYCTAVPTLVLNGMIFSLCGCYDFVRVYPDHQLAAKIFKEGIQTLVNILPHYNLGFWSRYNLCQADWYPKIDPATIGYQRLHVTQLNMLYQLTGQEIFREYGALFERQINLRNMIRMYRLKFSALKRLERL